jgi:hypothetical protein
MLALYFLQATILCCVYAARWHIILIQLYCADICFWWLSWTNRIHSRRNFGKELSVWKYSVHFIWSLHWSVVTIFFTFFACTSHFISLQAVLYFLHIVLMRALSFLMSVLIMSFPNKHNVTLCSTIAINLPILQFISKLYDLKSTSCVNIFEIPGDGTIMIL